MTVVTSELAAGGRAAELADLVRDLLEPLGAIRTAAFQLTFAHDEVTIGRVRGVVDRQVGQLTVLIDELADELRARGPR